MIKVLEFIRDYVYSTGKKDVWSMDIIVLPETNTLDAVKQVYNLAVVVELGGAATTDGELFELWYGDRSNRILVKDKGQFEHYVRAHNIVEVRTLE